MSDPVLVDRRPGKPLAITGMGCVGAPGSGLAAQIPALKNGASGLQINPNASQPLAQKVPVGAVRSPLPHLPSRTQALALCAAKEAFQQAGITKNTAASFGVVVGSCTGGMPESEAYYLNTSQTEVSPIYRRQHPHRSTQMLARLLGVHGPQGTHALACASAAAAIIEAMELVRSGICPGAIAVGSDALTRVTLAGFTSLMLVDPHGCRPLTLERAGMSLGEGAAALVIEDPDHARKRGATIQASLLGWGQYADAFHLTSPEPEGYQLERAVRDAINDSGISFTDVNYINAHGTGTKDNDNVESKVLNRLFGQIPTASTKRNYGHTMGAAAAIEAVASCLALQHDTMWASCGAETGTPISEIEVLTKTRDKKIDVVLSTTLAFGGINACLAFGKGERCA